MQLRAERFQFSLLTAILLMFFVGILMHGIIHDPNLSVGFFISTAATYGLFKLGSTFDLESLGGVFSWVTHSIFLCFLLLLMGLSALLSVFYFCAITSQMIARF
jgi:hypothetical protein